MGYTELLESIPIQIKSADIDGLETLGIVIDADENAMNRWQAVRNRLSQAGYPSLPKIPDKCGTIIPGDADIDLPTVGVWLMPDNAADGMLETLIFSCQTKSLIRFGSMPNRPLALFATITSRSPRPKNQKRCYILGWHGRRNRERR